MARYPSVFYGRRRGRTRRWIYIVSALLIIAVVAAFIYGYWPFGEIRSKASVAPGGADLPAALKTARQAKSGPGVLEIVAGPTAEPNPKVDEIIAEAMALVNDSPAQICEVRDRLNEALAMPMSPQQWAGVKKQLSKLADEWLFSRRIFPQDKLCESYKVKVGDQLRTIGKQHKVPYEILMKLNNISRPKEELQAGETIKVINGPFHAKIYRSTFTMDLYLGNTFVKSFPVGLGKRGMETPTGLWRVKPGGKLIKPVWTDRLTGKTYHPEDPDYPLGSRWIGLEGIEGQAKGRTGIAIHGWKDRELMAEGGSRGCIRLQNGDVILMYDLLVPTHSLIRVEE